MVDAVEEIPPGLNLIPPPVGGGKSELEDFLGAISQTDDEPEGSAPKTPPVVLADEAEPTELLEDKK
jgi:hypothetical protein